MQKIFIALLTTIVFSPHALSEEDLWFDVGRHRFAVDINLGNYSDAGYLQRLGLRAPMIGESEVSFAYSRVTGNDDIVVGTEQYQNNQSAVRAGASTDPMARWVGSVSYENGSTDLSESYNQWLAALGFNYARGFIQLTAIAGEDELELPVPRLLREPVILNYQRDRVGMGLMASYYTASWVFFGSFRDYTLAADELTRSDEPVINWRAWRAARENYIEQRSRRRLVGLSSTYSTGTSSNGFQQIGSIAERVWQLSVATSIKTWLVSAGYSGYEGFISGGAINSYFVTGTIPLSSNIDISVLASVLEDSNAVYSELGAKLHW